MKVLLFFVICAATAISCSYAARRVCVLNANNCRSTAVVCGRSGRSNQCRRFRNSCALQIANCRSNTSYTRVATSECRNLSGYRSGRCRTNSSTTSTGTNSGLNGGSSSNLLGSSISNLLGSSSSNVNPIVIG